MPVSHHTPLLLFGALALAAAAFGAQGFGRPGPPPPFDDHDLMMKRLGVSKLRRGPDPNAPSNSDESLANPYKDTIPDVLTMKDGTQVTTPAQWAKRLGPDAPPPGAPHPAAATATTHAAASGAIRASRRTGAI